MIKEIALDPRLFAQWPHHLLLRDAFGVEKGRVISAFPKKWRGHVREEVNRLEASGEIAPVKAQSLRRWLEASVGAPDSRMISCKLAYDGNKDWHLNAEDNQKAFDAILSDQEIEAANAIRADEEHEYVRDPKFRTETQRTIQRRSNVIVDSVWPLLRDSKVVKLVEPHFNPRKTRFCDVLEAMLDRLHTEGSVVREVELHMRNPDEKTPNDFDQPSFTLDEMKKKLSPLLRTGWSLKVHLWTRGREKMHPRYLLTDRGGIQIDHGWDEGEPNETTPIMLMEKKRWEQEIARYQPGTTDFKLDPARDIVLIE